MKSKTQYIGNKRVQGMKEGFFAMIATCTEDM